MIIRDFSQFVYHWSAEREFDISDIISAVVLAQQKHPNYIYPGYGAAINDLRFTSSAYFRSRRLRRYLCEYIVILRRSGCVDQWWEKDEDEADWLQIDWKRERYREVDSPKSVALRWWYRPRGG